MTYKTQEEILDGYSFVIDEVEKCFKSVLDDPNQVIRFARCLGQLYTQYNPIMKSERLDKALERIAKIEEKLSNE